jgi:hypothetical protein
VYLYYRYRYSISYNEHTFVSLTASSNRLVIVAESEKGPSLRTLYCTSPVKQDRRTMGEALNAAAPLRCPPCLRQSQEHSRKTGFHEFKEADMPSPRCSFLCTYSALRCDSGSSLHPHDKTIRLGEVFSVCRSDVLTSVISHSVIIH